MSGHPPRRRRACAAFQVDGGFLQFGGGTLELAAEALVGRLCGMGPHLGGDRPQSVSRLGKIVPHWAKTRGARVQFRTFRKRGMYFAP